MKRGKRKFWRIHNFHYNTLIWFEGWIFFPFFFSFFSCSFLFEQKNEMNLLYFPHQRLMFFFLCHFGFFFSSFHFKFHLFNWHESISFSAPAEAKKEREKKRHVYWFLCPESFRSAIDWWQYCVMILCVGGRIQIKEQKKNEKRATNSKVAQEKKKKFNRASLLHWND